MKKCAFAIVFVLCSCAEKPVPLASPATSPEQHSSASEQGRLTASPPFFVDVAAQAGISFRHFTSADGAFLFPEIMGSGVALLDIDNDGDLDVYALQGAAMSPKLTASPPINRLYRNELYPNGTLTFTDITESSGLGDAGYGMGVAIGDTDNDGDPDVFIGNFGANRFFQNNGNGTFTRVAGAFAVDDAEEWTTSASFTDIDNDGDLDLFATNYVGFTVANNIKCSNTTGQREYCSPNVYPPSVDRLWRNDGDNTFVDISQIAGIGAAPGNGLGTSAADFDSDGDIDLYVANDLQANFLWTQDDDGIFSNTALMSGSAYNANGETEASMGVSAGDFDADGDEDLFMTHLNSETNTLYENDGAGNFTDRTNKANLAASSVRLTGFGTGWLDYDNDGWLDLFIANGAVVKVADPLADPAFPYGQPNQLMRNENGRFRDMSAIAGNVFGLRDTSRGAVFGDLDNDGDTDVVVSAGNGPLRVMLNQLENNNNWLRVKLVGTRAPRNGAGTRLRLRLKDGRTLWRRAHTDGSYLSASDIRVNFGLGATAMIESISAFWTSGLNEQWHHDQHSLKVNQQISLTEGTGEPLATSEL